MKDNSYPPLDSTGRDVTVAMDSHNDILQQNNSPALQKNIDKTNDARKGRAQFFLNLRNV